MSKPISSGTPIRRRITLRRLLFGSALADQGWAVNLAWALFRLHIGLSIAIGAGWSKLINKLDADQALPWSWSNIRFGVGPWFVDQVAGLGFTYPSPRFWALAAAWGELVGGLGIAIGLLTRWNGIQLAVQFFVIAFLWYNAPTPVVGMYYQQLLFWGYLLVACMGGGRLSLDHLLTARGPVVGPAGGDRI